MPFFFIYLLKLSVSLAVVFLFYQFVLRRLTFYNWNRWYLLGYTLLSFFIPFIDISSLLEKNEWTESIVVQWVPVMNNSSVSATTVAAGSGFFTAISITTLVIITGMLILLGRLLIQFISFRKMMKQAQCISDDDMKIYQVDENIASFSFGNSIFINRRLHTETEVHEIIRHEFVHVKQLHSIDILWGEILCLLNWYNPFAWLLKKSIRQNLEFIADNKVLENGVSKKEYQYLLLKVIGNNQYSIATQFNFSSLKKRIAMLNKLKSTKVHLVKFLFLLPVVVVMLLAFRNKDEKMQQQAHQVTKDKVQDSIPKLPSAILSIDQVERKADDPHKGIPSGIILVTRKDGQKEVYDLNKKTDTDAFEKKYGVKLDDILPAPPTPPSPPAKKRSGVSLNMMNDADEIRDKRAVSLLKEGKAPLAQATFIDADSVKTAMPPVSAIACTTSSIVGSEIVPSVPSVPSVPTVPLTPVSFNPAAAVTSIPIKRTVTPDIVQ